MTLKVTSGYRRAFVVGAISHIDPDEFPRRATQIRAKCSGGASKDMPLILSGAELAGEHVFDMLQPRVEELENLAAQAFAIANKALSLAGEESTPALMEILEFRNLFVRSADQAWAKFYATLDSNLTHAFGVDTCYFTGDDELPLIPFLKELTHMAVASETHPYIKWLSFWLRGETPALYQVAGHCKLSEAFFSEARTMRDPSRSIHEYSQWVRRTYKALRELIDAEAKKYSMPDTAFNIAVADLYGAQHGEK